MFFKKEINSYSVGDTPVAETSERINYWKRCGIVDDVKEIQKNTPKKESSNAKATVTSNDRLHIRKNTGT